MKVRRNTQVLFPSSMGIQVIDVWMGNPCNGATIRESASIDKYIDHSFLVTLKALTNVWGPPKWCNLAYQKSELLWCCIRCCIVA